MRSRWLACGGAVVLIAVAATRGEAGLIPWSYQWEAYPVVVKADPLGKGGSSVGGITLTPGAIALTGDGLGRAFGSGLITAVNLSAFAFAPNPAGRPYRFTDAPYRLAVTLTDRDSGACKRLRFAGVFDGTFTEHKVDLWTHFRSPTTDSAVLGRNVYTVSLTSYTPPGPPALGSAGEIKVFVNVRPVGTPEPSSLLLAGAGLAVVLARPHSFRRKSVPWEK